MSYSSEVASKIKVRGMSPDGHITFILAPVLRDEMHRRLADGGRISNIVNLAVADMFDLQDTRRAVAKGSVSRGDGPKNTREVSE